MASDNYDKLYLSMLKIGRNNASTGISYIRMRELLIEEGYNFKNNCIDLAVRRWFYESFFHVGSDTNPYTEYAHLQNHLKCNFILTGDACLKLLDYENNAKNNRLAIIALILALLAIGYSIFHDYREKKVQSTQQLTPPAIIKGFQVEQNTNESIPKFDSLDNKLNSDTSLTIKPEKK